MRRHKAVTAVTLVVILVLAGTVVATAASGTRGVTLSDSSTCTEWKSATAAQQLAYAQRYVDEHPPPKSGQVWDAPTVRSLIGQDCTTAAYLGETDEVDLVGALQHAF